MQFSGSGSATSAARSDHDHLGQAWTGTDTPLILEGAYSFAPLVPEEQKGAPLVLENTDLAGYGLRITTTGNDAIRIDSAGGDGVTVVSPSEAGVRVFFPGQDGVFVNTAGDAGVRVLQSGGDGVYVNNAGEDGVHARSGFSGAYGGRFENLKNNGSGVYALGGPFGVDLVLGGNSISDDDGRISSDPGFTSSDIFLMSNDAVVIRLDQDNNEGGNFIVESSDGTNVLNLDENGNLTIDGTLTENSNVHAKTDISGADTQQILEALMSVEVSTWRYLDSPAALHLGPMAQDFHAAFGLGDSDTSISTIDRDGVALAAIQGLYQLLKEKDAVIAEQRLQLEALDDRLAVLEQALAHTTSP